MSTVQLEKRLRSLQTRVSELERMLRTLQPGVANGRQPNAAARSSRMREYMTAEEFHEYNEHVREIIAKNRRRGRNIKRKPSDK